MVSLVVGFPGSGKTYRAVKKIFDILSSNKPSEFEVIYTNIGGIKFDYFPNSQVEFKKLKEDELYNYLNECFKIYELHKDKENVDEYLIEYSKKQNFYNALIVFDECHDFFSNQDRVKIFWLTYHRHLHHEIILLTQNKSLINSKYRAIPEQFIEAQPRSKKLFSNTLNYKHYASFAMRRSDQFNTSSIKTDPAIFDLYQSGNKSNQKSILRKFIIIILFGIVVATFLFYNLLNNFSDDTHNLDQNLTKLEKKKPIRDTKPLKNKIEDENYFNMKILYDTDNGYKIYNTYYQSPYFNRFLITTKSKTLYRTTVLKIDNYLLQELIIRTSNNDLSKYFYLPDHIQNKMEIRRKEKEKRE